MLPTMPTATDEEVGDDRQNQIPANAANTTSGHEQKENEQSDGRGRRGSVSKIKSRRDLNYAGHVRPYNEAKAMTKWDRIKARLARFNGNSGAKTSNQVHIPPSEYRSLWKGVKLFCSLKYAQYAIWKIRTSHINFILSSVLEYLILVNLIAIIIAGIAIGWNKTKQRQCLNGWTYAGDASVYAHNFEVAFELSWTTLSTVGYGAVSPSTDTGCYLIRYICALEAFAGIIFTGYCGSIFYAKIGMVLSRANVKFSSALCVQFGNGIGEEQDLGTSQKPSSHANHKMSSVYPVLIIQIVNTAANEKDSSVVVDASLKGTLITNEKLDAALEAGHSFSNDPNVISSYSFDSESARIPALKMTRKIVHFKSSSNPYLKGIWNARHVLDERSPFLEQRVKDEIRHHGGWPPERNTHSSIRSSLVRFTSFLVRLRGTSTTTDSSVFIEKKYSFEDVCIGWQFARILYLTETQKYDEQSVRVDFALH